jgi:hypothetical protein
LIIAKYRLDNMSFLNPLFLVGALTAAVPILLHLIKRENARKIEFPTLMFLRRISKKTIRYQKLRHLLLLLLRLLAFMLIVLAFMRPYREEVRAATAVGRITSAHIIAIDNSMSMSYQDRWSRAKQAAADVVRRSNADDKLALLEFSERTVIRTPLTTDTSDVLNQIENGVKLSDQSTRYAQALRIAEKVALEAGTGKRIIHLISDFQKSGLASKEREFHLGAGLELQYVDVGSDKFTNLAFRDVHVIEADPRSGAGLRIKASLVNYGNEDRRDVRVRLIVDDRTVADKRIDSLKGSAQAVEFQLPGLTPGTHPAILDVDDPGLTRDNRFYMAVQARGKTPVLVVEDQDLREGRSPSFFLARALNVDAFSPYRLTAVSPQKLDFSGRLMIWNNVPGGNRAVQEKLKDFVKTGGGLIIALGDSIKTSDFNRSFGSWLPVKMAEAASNERRAGKRPAEDYIFMTDVRLDHPIFQPFGKPHSGTFSNVRFYSHSKVSVGPEAEVLARFDNGDPALVAINVERGRVLLFASSADDASNDLPLKAVYAPFWQQMLRYLENYREQRYWLDMGDILSPRKLLMETALRQGKGLPDPGEAVAVLDPEKQRLSIAPGSDSVLAEKAGFYEIRAMSLNAALAVNTAPAESDLSHGDAEEMTAGWTSSQPSVFSEVEKLTPEEQDRRQRIWSLLLAAALVFLISESLLSNSRIQAANDEKRTISAYNE